ncbi:imidazoleglycerol-phosphate dehydratase HisB [bacterium]|nr:imidazoleglycerol-phosphate dehydratase HisB [bacterium]
MRTAKIVRKTNETEIRLEINLDGTGTPDISTGLGFFDHMLTQIAVHGLMDISLAGKVDLEVGPHHLVEDCGLALGAAFSEALADRKGIVRMGSAFVPMDDALAQVVIDFSGRPYAVINAEWVSPFVSDLPTSLIEHFFQSFAMASLANLHVRVLYGRDNHHIAESMFKAFARAVMAAVQIDPRRGGQIPSSKGVLT